MPGQNAAGTGTRKMEGPGLRPSQVRAGTPEPQDTAALPGTQHVCQGDAGLRDSGADGHWPAPRGPGPEGPSHTLPGGLGTRGSLIQRLRNHRQPRPPTLWLLHTLGHWLQPGQGRLLQDLEGSRGSGRQHWAGWRAPGHDGERRQTKRRHQERPTKAQ